MKRTCGKILVALLAALVLAAGCGSDDDDVSPAAEYKVLAGRLVWCAESLERATVPENASSIGNNAFRNCPALTSVSIPASVEQIGSSTFSGVAVKEITYGNTMRAWDALARGSGIVATLAEITVRCTDGIWGAGMYDWEITDGVLTRYCGDAAVAVIPKSVTAIGDGAFAGRADITGVTIPGGVTSIGADAFKDCAKLTGIGIPDGVTGIGAEAFAGCAGLADIDIPASVESIGTGAIGAGTTVTYRGTKAQWEALAANAGLEGLTAFIIDGNGTLTGYCGSAADIALPDGVKGIAGGAFADHAELERVTIPADVTAIAPDTFTGSGITEISYGGTMAEWGALVEAGGIAAEVADITVTCADGTWTPTHTHDWIGECTDNGDGTHRRTCAGCGRQSLPEAHTWGSHTSGGADGHHQICTACNAASATEPHQYAYTGSDADSHTETCSLCAHAKSEPHAYGGETCTDAGHTKSCADCGHSETKPHKWSSYTDDGTGYHSRTCTADGFEAHTERVAHSYGTTYTDDNNGKHYQTCSVCNGQSEAVAHTWGAYTSGADGHYQTCTAADCGAHSDTVGHSWGEETYTTTEHSKTCSLCTYSTSKPHNWSGYTADGTDTHSRTCAPDGFEAHTERVAHTYGTTYTDDNNGKHYRTCSVCSGQSEAVAHSYGTTYTDDKNGKHYQTCSVCNGQSEAVAHSYGTTYTDDKNGKHYQTCSACNAKSASVAHDCKYKDNGDGTHTTTCTKCDYAKSGKHEYENDICKVCECPNPATVYAASTGSDTTGNGTKAKPFATIQKAIDTVIARNDGTSAYTIYVDGTLDGTTAAYIGANGMADFSALNKKLTLTIKSLSETTKATLDGGARFDADGNITNAGIGKRIINAKPASGALNLTLENLTIKGGNATGDDNGGGIHFESSGGVLTMNGCEVLGNKAKHGGGVYISGSGTFIMESGTISNNTAQYGGGVCVSGGTFTMKDGTISYNTATKFNGGGVYVSDGTFTMDGGTITNNTAHSSGGGVCVRMGTFTMNSGTIKNCTADSLGGGVYLLFNTAIFTMNGGEISNCTAGSSGGGVYNIGKFEMTGGEIKGNTATGKGGGVYNIESATFTPAGGTVSGNTPNDVYTAR